MSHSPIGPRDLNYSSSIAAIQNVPLHVHRLRLFLSIHHEWCLGWSRIWSVVCNGGEQVDRNRTALYKMSSFPIFNGSCNKILEFQRAYQ